MKRTSNLLNKIKAIIGVLLAGMIFTACPAGVDYPSNAEVRFFMVDNVAYRMASYYSEKLACDVMEMQNIPLNVEGIEESIVDDTVCEINNKYFIGWAPEADTLLGKRNRLYAFNANGKVKGYVDLGDVGMVYTSDKTIFTCSKNYDENNGGFKFSLYNVSEPVLGKLSLNLKWDGYLDLFVHDVMFDYDRNVIVCGSDKTEEKLHVYYIKNDIFGSSCTKIYSTERLGGKENPEFMRLLDHHFDLFHQSLYAFTSVQNMELEQKEPRLHFIQKEKIAGSSNNWQDISKFTGFPEDFRCIYAGAGLSCQLDDGDLIIPYVTDNNENALMFISRRNQNVAKIIRKTKGGMPFRGIKRNLNGGFHFRTGDQYFIHSASDTKKECFATINYMEDFICDYDEIPIAE